MVFLLVMQISNLQISTGFIIRCRINYYAQKEEDVYENPMP